MVKWPVTTFEKLYEIPSRNGLSKPSRVRGSGYKMINMGELFANDRIYDINMELVPLTDIEKEKAKILPFDLLFARQSLVAAGAGKCSIVMETSDLTVFESHLIRVRLNKLIADPFFYYYYFRSSCSPMQTIIQHCVQAGIKASDLSKLEVVVPPLCAQRKISSVLMSIDKKIEENKKINNFIDGVFTKKDSISPAYINKQNPKYFEVDNLFYSSLIVVNYYREQTDLLLKNLVETNINMNISIFYEKQDSYKTIKDLTYHIGNVGVELKESNENRQDIDIAAYTYNDAKYIRKEIQVNNEELYFLYIYINLYANTIKELEYNLNKIEGIAQSKGMQTRRANFRQEECFLAGLPIMENKEIIKEAAKRNILTTGLLATYPFISSTIFDKNGIFIGTNIYNNSLVFIDRYNTEKYKNANICIFGTSGAGKSFYTKLLILRYKLLGIKQYIIDPDREYNKICEKLKGVEIKLGPTSNTYINVLEIRKESIEDGENGYLAIKISKLIGFFNLIFGELDEEEKALLEEKLIQVYKLKNINFDDKSLYNENGEFKNEIQMPILGDLFNILGQDERTKKFKIKLIPFVEGSMKFFNNYSNIKLDNELIVADIYDLGEENLKYGMYILIDVN